MVTKPKTRAANAILTKSSQFENITRTTQFGVIVKSMQSLAAGDRSPR
jgi:hypothetical protein